MGIEAANQALKEGNSLTIIVGGIAEMYLLHPDKEIVKLRSRKGFVRLAVENGVNLTPVYHFGNSQLFAFGPSFLSNLSRKLGMAIGVYLGRWYLPIPMKHDLMIAAGRIINVTKMSRKDPQFNAY